MSELSTNEQLLRLSSTECLSPNDPFWNQLLSFTFVVPRNRYRNRRSCVYLVPACFGAVDKKGIWPVKTGFCISSQRLSHRVMTEPGVTLEM